jgi:hypothetical protein
MSGGHGGHGPDDGFPLNGSAPESAVERLRWTRCTPGSQACLITSR